MMLDVGRKIGGGVIEGSSFFLGTKFICKLKVLGELLCSEKSHATSPITWKFIADFFAQFN